MHLTVDQASSTSEVQILLCPPALIRRIRATFSRREKGKIARADDARLLEMTRASNTCSRPHIDL